MADLGQNYQFFPAIIILSKVFTDHGFILISAVRQLGQLALIGILFSQLILGGQNIPI